jgi:hypothetical protein
LAPGVRRTSPPSGRAPRAALEAVLDGAAHPRWRDAQVGEDLRGAARLLADETQQQVLRADMGVVEALGLLLGADEHPPRLLGEFVELIGHGRSSSGGVTRSAAVAQHTAGQSWGRAGLAPVAPDAGGPRRRRLRCGVGGGADAAVGAGRRGGPGGTARLGM